ncbi:hypothetical protein CTA2_5612 [Colletotrichum tanaceti]|nr:hypothetical protein CTA2_5612 [Colletotrichum tanaceti]
MHARDPTKNGLQKKKRRKGPPVIIMRRKKKNTPPLVHTRGTSRTAELSSVSPPGLLPREAQVLLRVVQDDGRVLLVLDDEVPRHRRRRAHADQRVVDVLRVDRVLGVVAADAAAAAAAAALRRRVVDGEGVVGVQGVGVVVGGHGGDDVEDGLEGVHVRRAGEVVEVVERARVGVALVVRREVMVVLHDAGVVAVHRRRRRSTAGAPPDLAHRQVGGGRVLRRVGGGGGGGGQGHVIHAPALVLVVGRLVRVLRGVPAAAGAESPAVAPGAGRGVGARGVRRRRRAGTRPREPAVLP